MRFLKIKKALRAFFWKRDLRALRHGVAASLEHSACLRRHTKIKTIVDIGANKGQFALEAVKWHDATVIAFEPLKRERGLIELIFADRDRFTVHPFALGNTDGNVDFHVSAASDSSSVLDQTSLQTDHFPETQNKHVEKVEIRRLDQLVDKKDLVHPVLGKIDVQGFELSVLEGFGDLLKAFDYLIIELSNVSFYAGAPNSAVVISYLSSRGFHIENIYNMYQKDGVCLQADFLFARDVNGRG
tara:strand:+ start:11156 stop:11884 length:729 start_codon:yes stop_codon:yes gene_type:complete